MKCCEYGLPVRETLPINVFKYRIKCTVNYILYDFLYKVHTAELFSSASVT
jgi:hypothetical protein